MSKDDKKDVTIIVNGQEKIVEKDDISFEELVALAFDPAPGPNVEVTISYTRGHGEKPAGTLVAGQTVKVKEGMIFNVTSTDRS